MQRRLGLLLTLTFFSLVSQGKSYQPARIKRHSVNPISVGDAVPDISFSHLINSQSKNLRLSDFKGKLVLLDFWATSCGSCVASFPKLDSLQAKYKNKIKIILVASRFNKANYEDAKKVSAFFAKWEKRNSRKFNLPHDARNDLANDLFPHEFISHVVWIGADRKVKGITGSGEVIADNIEAILNTGEVDMPVKKDVFFDGDQLLYAGGNGGDGSDILYHSILSRYTDGVRANAGVYPSTENPILVYKINCLNASIPQLYQWAIPEIFSFPFNRYKLNVKDRAKYFGDYRSRDWIEKNLYCYELAVPPTTSETIHQLMREDLNRYFGLSVKIEKQKTLCNILKKSGNMVKAVTKGGKRDNNLEEKNGLPKFLNNESLSTFVMHLNTISSIPVLDETGFSEKVDIQLPADLSNIVALKQSLQQYGFDLTEEDREIDMFIMTEN